MAVTIALMGRLAIEVDGAATTDARLGQLGRVALAYLVLERHRPVSRDELADALWGERLPPTWDAALRGVVSRVRTAVAVAGGSVRSEFGCYQLDLPAGVVVDVEQAEADLERDAAAAVAVTGGQFLPGSTGQWVERRQADYAALHVRALEALAAAASAGGDHGRAVAAAQEAVERAPLQESAYQRLMAAHARAGNRAAALAAYERCRDALADELGVSPSAATDALYVRLLSDEPVAEPAPPGVRTNLPADRTTFVGRAGQLDELAALLASTRLLTLTGPGGVGKSRLALRVAERASDACGGGLAADEFADGTWLVELAGLADGALVPQQCASVLGVPETATGVTEALASFLSSRRMLLVLDNCEHVLAACASLIDVLLRAAPGVRVISTSREPVGVPGETTWVVPPLSGDEAEQLFRDRVAAAATQVDLATAAVAGQVTAICARLDGVPLAIELAAARARVLPLAEIATRLDDRLRVLVGGPRAGPERHQTVRATIDWSYSTLPPAEQRLFARLSVFAGGFGLAAAERVCAEPDRPDDVVEGLAALVDKSLVALDRSRYAVLETLRQYGAERLADAGEADVLRDRHLDWAVEVAEEAERVLEGGDQQRLLRALDADHDNLRLALDHAAARDRIDEGMRLASSLMRFWEIRGYLGQGRARLVALAAHGEGSPALRAKSLNAAAVLAQRQADYPTARTLYQESLVIQRALGDRLGTATALHGLANLAVGDGDLVTARALFEENLAIGRELGRPRMEAASLMNLGVVVQSSFMRGARPLAEAGPEARRYYEESRALYRRLGDRFNEALALENIGTLVRFIDGPDAARVFHEESIAIRRELGDKLGIAASARYLVPLVLRCGEIKTAREISEELLHIERELGNEAHIAEASLQLGEIAVADGDLHRAWLLLTDAEASFRRLDNRYGLARTKGILAEITRRWGEFERSEAFLDEFEALAGELDNPNARAWCLVGRARLERSRGRRAEALAWAGQALTLAGNDMPGVEASVLDLAGGLAVESGDALVAARLLAAAERLKSANLIAPDPDHTVDMAKALADVGEAAFAAAWADGKALSPEDRRELARQV